MKCVTPPLSAVESFWLFLMDLFLHSLLAITNLLSNRKIPRMSWHLGCFTLAYFRDSRELLTLWDFPRGLTRENREERQAEKNHFVKVLNAKLRPLDFIGYSVESHWRLLFRWVKWSTLYFRKSNSTLVWKLVWKGNDLLLKSFKNPAERHLGGSFG